MKFSNILAATFAFSVCGATARELEPIESLPKEVGGLEFSIVTQARWESQNYSNSHVELQLRIKNTGSKPLVFPTYETFDLILKKADGSSMSFPNVGRDGTLNTPNFILKPGSAFSYPLNLELRTGAKETKLVFNDGTGSWAIAPIAPGRYSVAFSLRTASDSSMLPTNLSAPLWSGTGQTDSVEVVLTADLGPAKLQKKGEAAPFRRRCARTFGKQKHETRISIVLRSLSHSVPRKVHGDLRLLGRIFG